MKKSQMFRLATIPLTLTTLGVIGTSCGNRQTQSNDATRLAANYQKAANAGGVSAVPKVSIQLDEIRKQLRDATEFWKLSLAEESKERRAADESIRSEVLALDKKVTDLQKKLELEILALAEQQKLLDDKVEKQGDSLRGIIDVERSERQAADALIYAKIAEEKKALEDQVADVKKDLDATKLSLSNAKAELQAAIAAESASRASEILSVKSLVNTTSENLKSEMTSKIDSNIESVRSALELAKSSLEQKLKDETSARSANLASLSADLTKKIASAKKDAIDRAEKALATAVANQSEDNQKRIAQIAELDRLTRSNASALKSELLNQMNSNMSQVDVWMREAGKSVDAQIKRIDSRIDTANTTSDELKKTMESNSSVLSKRIEDLAKFEASSREELRIKLSSQLQSNIEDVRSSLTNAKNQLEADLISAQVNLERNIRDSNTAIKIAMDANDATLAAKLQKEMVENAKMQSMANEALQNEVTRLDLLTRAEGQKMKEELERQMQSNMDTVSGWVSAARTDAQNQLKEAVTESKVALIESIVESNRKIEQLNTKVDTQNTELSVAVDRERIAREQQGAALAKRQSEFEALQAKITKAQNDKNGELEAQLKAQQADLQKLAKKQEEDRIALELSIQATNARITQVRNELKNELNTRSNMLEKRISMTRSELKDDLAKQASGTAQELQNLRKDLNAAKYALEKRVAGVQSEMLSLNAELTKAVEENNTALQDQLKKEIAAREMHDAAMRGEIKNLSDLTSKQDAALRSELTQTMAKNMDQVAGWVENARSEAAKANQELLSQLSSLDQKVALSQDELKKELINQMNKSISSVRSELNTAKQSLQMRLEMSNRNLNNLINQKTFELSSASAQTRASLEKEIAQMKVAQEKQNAAMTTQISTIELMTKKDGEAMKAELEGLMSKNMGLVESWVNDARSEAERNLVAVVGATEARLVNAMVAGDNAVREQMTAQINDVSEQQSKDLLAFKQHVDATYAKRTELAQLQNFVNGIKNAVSYLDAKVDDNDARLSAEIRTTRAQLSSQIRSVRASVDSLRGDFTNHVSTYEKKVAELSKESRNAAAELRKELMSYKAMDAEAQQKLESTIQNLANKITNTEAFATQTRDALAQKIVELEQKDSELANDVRTARNEVTKTFNDALAKEQAERKAIANEVVKLQAEVQRVSQVASQALNLAKANDLAVAGLREDLAKAEANWKNQLDGLRGQMKNEIAEVKGFAEGLVKGLGEQVQKQFTETAATLAETKAKIAGLGSELGRTFDKPFASSADPTLSGTANMEARAKRIAIFNEKVAINKSEDVGGVKRSVQDLAAQRAGEFSSVLSQVEAEFLLAIDYAETKFGDSRPIELVPFNKSFAKDVAGFKVNNSQVCFDGYTGFKDNTPEGEYRGLMAGVGNKEWWAHLARAYVSMLVSGSRSGDVELDKIFHGVAPVADGLSLQSALAMATVPSHASGASGECIARVNDWAKAELTSSNERSVKLRKILADHNGLKQLLATRRVKSAYDALGIPSAKIESLAKDTLKSAFGGDEAKTIAYMRAGDSQKSDPGFFVQAAQIIHEAAALHDHEIALEANKDAISNVAREANKNSEEFRNKLASLESQLAKFAKLDERVGNLEKSQAAAFGLIAAMATRLGFADLVEKAKTEIGNLAVQPDPSLTLELGCKATSHFFNYANEGESLKRCDSGVSTVDGMLGDSGGCRTKQNNVTNINTNTNVNTHTHTDTNTTVNQTQYNHYYTLRYRNTRCGEFGWCDFYRNTYWVGLGSSWSTSVSSTSSSSQSQQVTTSTQESKWVEMQEAFVGALRTPWLSPLDSNAQTILRRAAGAPFPSDRKTMIGLRVFGNASKWKIEDPESGRNITVDADDFKVSDTAKGLVYEIPASMFLSKTDGRAGFTEMAKVTALDAFGEASAKTCFHSMNGGTTNTSRTSTSSSSSSSASSSSSVRYNTNSVSINHGNYVSWYTSPIVLDFSGQGKLATVEPRKSNAMFDIEGSGLKNRVGWIGKNSGLLALDRNNNGQIDSGRELFGNYTITRKGERAWNGYEALAEYDTNKDGMIDKKDKIFSRLVVWMDGNGDGKTQRGELKKLAQLGVTAIGVKYSSVPTPEQAQHKGTDSTNLALYQGKFYGTICPSTGCASFDVYFGYDTTVQPVASK
jgi:hypothetical protein